MGQRLLTAFKDIAGLKRTPFEEGGRQHGIDRAKAAQLKAAIELGARLSVFSPEERPTINSPAATALVSYEGQGRWVSLKERGLGFG